MFVCPKTRGSSSLRSSLPKLRNSLHQLYTSLLDSLRCIHISEGMKLQELFHSILALLRLWLVGRWVFCHPKDKSSHNTKRYIGYRRWWWWWWWWWWCYFWLFNVVSFLGEIESFADPQVNVEKSNETTQRKTLSFGKK